jgi:hypothetical protein
MSGLRLFLVSAVSSLVAACGHDSDSDPRARASDVRDLGLTRQAPVAYRRVCERQAREAPSRARSCPPLVPAGRLKVLYRGRSLGREGPAGGYSADFASPSLGRLRGRRVGTNGGHWHYDAAWAPAMREAVVRVVERPADSSKPSACGHRRIARTRMEVCRVVAYRRGGGLHGGHVAYIWSSAGVTYVISLHGYANEPRARAMMSALVSATD